MTATRFNGDERFVTIEPPAKARGSVATLFASGYAHTAVSLWIICFMGLLVIYLPAGWLPTMMRDAGLSIARRTTSPRCSRSAA